MWNAEKPLTAAEVVRAQEDLNIHKVQVSLKKLLNMKQENIFIQLKKLAMNIYQYLSLLPLF